MPAPRKRRTEHPSEEQHADSGSFVTNRELDAKIESVRTELKWLRWLILGVLGMVAAPKVGGPDAAKLTAELARTFLRT